MLFQSDNYYNNLFLDEMDDYLLNLTYHNERQKCVNIKIIDDTILESAVEIFNLILTRTEGLDERIQFTTDKRIIKNGMYCCKLVIISLFSSQWYSRSGEDNVHCIRR